jgi:hypothetical protein
LYSDPGFFPMKPACSGMACGATAIDIERVLLVIGVPQFDEGKRAMCGRPQSSQLNLETTAKGLASRNRDDDEP